MRLEQLYGFQSLADYGSIRKASSHLYTTPQNLSKLMISLENELNTSLFIRSHSGITLTEDGKKAYDMISNVIHELDLLKAEFQVHSPLEKQLRLCPVYITCGGVFEPLASAVTNQLIEDFPSTPIQIDKKSSMEIISLLSKPITKTEDVPDLAILAIYTKAVPDFISKLSHIYDFYSLMEDTLHLQVPKKDPLSKLDKIPFKLLETLPLLLYNGNPRSPTAAEYILAQYGCIPKNVSRTSNLETCSQQALNQKKYCFVGYPSVEFRPLPKVAYVPFEVNISSFHILLKKKKASNQPFCDAFSNYFFDCFGKTPL